RRRPHAADEVVVVGAALVRAEVLALREVGGDALPAVEAGHAGALGLGAAGRAGRRLAAVVDVGVLVDAVAAGHRGVQDLGTIGPPALERVVVRGRADADRVERAGREVLRAAVGLVPVGVGHPLGRADGARGPAVLVARALVGARGAVAGVGDEPGAGHAAVG